jgi:ATP adenylyltransferase
MKHLYAPWRGSYVRDSEREVDPDDISHCIFCRQFEQSCDSDNFIIRRFEHVAVILNIYPYNSGHILVVPYAHVPALPDLTPEARWELMQVISDSTQILHGALNNDGANVGINLGGKAAGGSVPGHLHVHVLPRWLGDTNFLPTLADTKQISANLHEVYQQLREAFDVFYTKSTN